MYIDKGNEKRARGNDLLKTRGDRAVVVVLFALRALSRYSQWSYSRQKDRITKKDSGEIEQRTTTAS